ncbi:OmpH family outer membrane protein [Paracrocinitomix mangrovi]|uniref:OmpH family outer membrane protein n=1 Tax=Paracrocinitomix mangrovi TaxID=2862509 RepID=UPI001C8DF2DD|nr:OmpH family outer membrane protein [Paracrocinitomix mangrovi]UKN03583.1 OmpH family outer membrane protein [Paracrocinitomix mangrovi]
MKKIIIAFIAIFTLGAFTTNAQDLKFAHVRSAEVLDSIQSYKDLVKEEGKINAEAQKQYQNIQKQMERIQMEADTTADRFQLDMLSSDFQKKQMDMQNLEIYTQNQLQILQERLMKLMEMYRDAVSEIAKKNGITYVFDADQQLLFAGPEGKDITNEVRSKLLEMDNANPVHRFE